jgi:3-hydroxyisobutyrate dehydrogenase-like beta-hydroxyacid dehydrogenase
MYDVLGDAGDALAGRVVANLSSDTPQAARSAAGWLAERGAELVVGGVMVPPELVGTDAAYVFYSGPRAVFEAHEPALRVVGRPDYRGEDPGLAQLYYQAQLTVFLTAGAAFVQAAALLGTAGVPARDYAPLAADVIGLLAGSLDEAGRQIDAADFPGEYGTAAMMAASAEHIAGAAAEAGLDPTLPAAVQALYGRLVAAGHGKDSPNQVVEVIRKKIG